MDVPPSWHVPLAAAAGASFSLLGISYRLSEDYGLQPRHVILPCTLIGATVFGLRVPLARWSDAPAAVWLWAACAAVSQYAVIRLLGMALRLGPLSPSWCAIQLGFLLTVPYAAFALGERVDGWQALALVSAVACVVVGSLEVRPAEAGASSPRPRSLGRIALFAGVLLAMLVSNGATDLSMKALNVPVPDDGQSLMGRYADLFRAAFYAMLGLTLAADFAVRGRFDGPVRPALLLGLLAAAGSIGGIWALTLSAAGPAAVVFTLRSVVALLLASAASVTVFREKPGPAWLATVVLGVLTVLLANADALLSRLG